MNNQSKFTKFQSLFVKIALMLTICMMMVGGVSTFVSLTREVSNVIEATIHRAQGESHLLAEQNIAPLKYQKTDVLVPLFDATVDHSDGSAIGIAAVAADGSLVAQSTGFRLEKAKVGESLLADIVKSALETGKPVLSPDRLMIAIPVFNENSGALIGAFAFQWNADSAIAAIYESEKIKLSLSLIIIAVALVGAMIASRQLIVRPVKNLDSAVQAIARHEYGIEIPGTRRRDEIGAISRAVDSLRLALAEGETLRKDSVYKSAAFNESSAAMMMIDGNGMLRYVNQSMTAMLHNLAPVLKKTNPDFDPEAIINKHVDVFHKNAAHLSRIFSQAEKGPAKIGMAVGDTRLQLTVAAVKDEGGEIVGYVVEWVDVTETWLNNAVIETIDAAQAKVITDLDGTITEVNATFASLLGVQKPDLVGQSITTYHYGSETGTDLMSILHNVTNAPFHGAMEFRATDGTLRVVNGTVSCVRDNLGAPIHLLMIAKDVTESEIALRSAQAERDEAERQQNRVVDALRVAMRDLSNGDLSCEITESFDGSYEDLRRDYNNTIATLSAVLSDVFNHAQSIRNEARDISGTADSLSRRTENTAATLEQTAAALDELTRSVASAAEGAVEADRVVRDAKVNAEQSGDVVLETVAAMDMISTSSQKITSIIKVIDDIAFQTNLLALNAGVEAARAGEAGRGFAVVASEVRALAQRSSDAAREINDLIARSAGQVRRGVELVGRTGEALKEIVSSVSDISNLVSEIAISSRQQSGSLAEINAAVNELDQSTQQNAARLEETTAASEALTTSASTMTEMISHFRLTQVNPAGDSLDPPLSEATYLKNEPQRSVKSIPAKRPNTGVAIRKIEDPDMRDLAAWEDF